MIAVCAGRVRDNSSKDKMMTKAVLDDTAAQSSAARKIHVMIVDDSKFTRKQIMDSLTRTELAEFTFTEAEDGIDALAKFQPSEVDFMLVDMQMPRMDGPRFIRKLRAGFKNCPPVIVVTAETNTEKLMAALEGVRVNGFMIKPLEAERFRHGVKALVDNLPDRHGTTSVPHGESVGRALKETLKQSCGLDLTFFPEDQGLQPVNVVVVSIPVFGDVGWSVSVGFERDAAVAAACKFAGLDFTFDSPDFGDAMAELANVLGANIIRILNERDIRAEMSMPKVICATELRTLIQSTTAQDLAYFNSPVGLIWTSVTVGMSPGILL